MIAIIDYGMGNATSVKKAFDFLKIKCFITNNPKDFSKAYKLLIPGVGSFGDAVDSLHNLNLFESIQEDVLVCKKPVLGICLGMQLMGKTSEESPLKQGLGFIDATCSKFNIDLKVPHVGWNDIEILKHDSPLFKNVPQNSDFYFVHSYHFSTTLKEKSSSLNYGYEFTSSLEKEHVFGTQFHPEKSQKYGLEILKNFGQI